MSTLTPTMKLVAPDVNDKKGKTIEDLAANFQYLDALFPIGTIYESTKPTNPGTFRGGTWTALEGRVLIGAGATYAAGTTGGSATHTHDKNGFGGVTTSSPSSGDYVIGGGNSVAQASSLPPYRSVYMWERTA